MRKHDECVPKEQPRPPISLAIKQIKDTAESINNCKPYQLAQAKIDECISNGDEACSIFWRRVWIRLMAEEHAIKSV